MKIKIEVEVDTDSQNDNDLIEEIIKLLTDVKNLNKRN